MYDCTLSHGRRKKLRFIVTIHVSVNFRLDQHSSENLTGTQGKMAGKSLLYASG